MAVRDTFRQYRMDGLQRLQAKRYLGCVMENIMVTIRDIIAKAKLIIIKTYIKSFIAYDKIRKGQANTK